MEGGECFPFGQPVRPHERQDRSPRDVFVLGAYPSALHVRWKATNETDAIAALPVDNGPEAFWTGENQLELIEVWKRIVHLDPKVDGSVSGAKNLNGSSGVALDTRYLQQLGISRNDTWITDCLPTYYSSDGVKAAIRARFHSTKPAPRLADHPSEGEIVKLATTGGRLAELRRDFEDCQPSTVITLGNSAARVLRAMLDIDVGPKRLIQEGYGARVALPNGATWLPLAHPGAIRRAPWRERHDDWLGSARH